MSQLLIYAIATKILAMINFFLLTARFRVSSSSAELESIGPWIATVTLESGTIAGGVTIRLMLTNPLNSKYKNNSTFKVTH